MSRTRHATRTEIEGATRPTRRRAKTRLTKLGARRYWPEVARPLNAGNHWGSGFKGGKHLRRDQRDAKVIGRRLERRRLNRKTLS